MVTTCLRILFASPARRMRMTMGAAILWCWGGLAPLTTALGADPVLPEGVAQIITADSIGTGLVLNESGQILTSRQFVAAGAGLAVRVPVLKDGKTEYVEVTTVRLAKAHPTLDLLLLEAKPPSEGKLVVASLPAPEAAVADGQECQVTYLPTTSAPKTAPGKILSSLVEVEGRPCLKVDAPAGATLPGSPVTNPQGKLLGMVVDPFTFPSAAAGCAVADPLKNLPLDQFVSISSLRAVPEGLKERLTSAQEAVRAVGPATGAERTQKLRTALDLNRKLLVLTPRAAATLVKVAELYEQLGSARIAMEYLNLMPTTGFVEINGFLLKAKLHLAKVPPERDLAIESLERGLRSPTSSSNNSSCALELGLLMLEDGHIRTAAFCLGRRDGYAPATNQEERAKRALAWQKIDRLMPARETMSTNEGSRFDFGAYESIKKRDIRTPVRPRESANVATTSTSTPKAPSPASPVSESLPPGWYDLPLPASPSHVLLTDGGKRLAMLLPELKQVGIYDLGARKFEGFIAAPEATGFKFAAAGDVLAVYQPLSREIETYSVTTRRKTSSRKLEGTGIVSFLGMAQNQPGRIFALIATGDLTRPAYLTLPDLSLRLLNVGTPTKPAAARGMYLACDSFDGEMDAAGNLVAVYASMNKGQSAALMELKSDDTVNFRSLENASFPIRPTPSGTHLITSTGAYTAGQFKKVLAVEQGAHETLYIIAPIQGYDGIAAMAAGNPGTGQPLQWHLRVLNTSNLAVVSELTLTGKSAADVRQGVVFRDHSYLASAALDCHVFINRDDRRMRIFPLGLKSQPTKSGAATGDAGTIAVPGRAFRRKLSPPPGTTLTLESGPNGMKLDPSTQELFWSVPADQEKGRAVQVVLLVKKADGSIDYQIERIPVP